MKSHNLTPPHLRCDWGGCPSIHRLEDGRLLVVGQSIDETTPLGDIGDNEDAVIISPDLLDTLKAEWVRATIRYLLTHSETYVNAAREGEATARLPEHSSFLVMRPDRVNPGELLPRSAAHRDARIQAIGDVAVAVLLPSVPGEPA